MKFGVCALVLLHILAVNALTVRLAPNDPNDCHQTMENFGASDAWSCQFVGKNWPIMKRRQLADLLFSTDMDSLGNPKGIGLTAWRFNIGAGSAEQGESSQIGDQWRRAEGFMQPDGSMDWTKQQGQRWFLKAAKERGVDTFLGFSNSPPVFMTKNGLAFSSGGNSSNLPLSQFTAFAAFLRDVALELKTRDGIELDYLSPVNEPQWDWLRDSGQEGTPWLNSEIAALARTLNTQLEEEGVTLSTRIEISEAAQISFLYSQIGAVGRGNQIDDFFAPSSRNYIGDLSRLPYKIAGHSYFTTYPNPLLTSSRVLLKAKLDQYPGLDYWMSEYCLLEDNEEIRGPGRDLGMGPALYMARLIHADLTLTNAKAWQWWIAISPYDYKDGLIHIDYNVQDGNIYPAKLLWAFGNFARFVRPGMERLEVHRDDTRLPDLNGVMVSSFRDPETLKVVVVAINYSQLSEPLLIEVGGMDDPEFDVFETSDTRDLAKVGRVTMSSLATAHMLPPRSVTTLVQI